MNFLLKFLQNMLWYVITILRTSIIAHKILKLIPKAPRKFAFQKYASISAKLNANKEKKPIIIFCTARSGSNWLMSLLSQHENSSFLGEILNSNQIDGPNRQQLEKHESLKHIERMINSTPKEICGAKILLEQLPEMGLEVHDIVELYPSAKFIILYRSNLLDQFVSRKILNMTKSATSRVDKVSMTLKVTVRVNDFQDYCKKIRLLYKNAVEQIPKSRVVITSYDSLVENPQRVMNSIFTGENQSTKISAETHIKKQSPDNTYDRIINSNEIQQFVDANPKISILTIK